MKGKTYRKILLNFVEANGPQSWTSLHNLVLSVGGQPICKEKRGWGTAYISNSGYYKQTVTKPTSTEPRYLCKESDGLYHIHS